MRNLYALAFVLLSANVFSCSCVGPLSAAWSYKHFDVVVAVKVLEIKDPIGRNDILGLKNGEEVYDTPIFGSDKVLEVMTCYKGKGIQDTLLLKGENSNCELFVQVGTEYLIYGNLKDGALHTSMCTRSGLLAQHPDLPYLEKKRK